ncbi:sensor histidine kinase [Actinopolymorpha alba]|uniref:sensor histidine kinase n=1 Tax=Actinopolymorpha alba TaxID=533267 RepID=UPI0003A8DF75|nr:sensor histidine kinase [Actinopolymorpha alba]
MQRRAPSFRLPVMAQDVLLALFITVMQVQGIDRVAGESVSRPLTDLGYLGYALPIVSGLVIAVRRRWPVPVFVTTALASLVYYGFDFPDAPTWLGLFVALYTLTAYGDGRRSLVTAGVGIGVLTVAWLVFAADIEPRAAIGWVFFRIGASVMSAALGESVRSRRFIAAEAQERAERAEHTREEEARSRVDAERLRIAREVHDTVAHAIAIINVQAGVTAHVLDKRPEQAREALIAIEQTSSQALREMRAILGVLRDANDGRVPHPGLGQIDELTAKARDAGLDINLEAMPPAVPLPSAVGSAAYRVLQESITNVIRHVGPTRVTVALDYGIDVLEVRVSDEGRRGAPAGGPSDYRPRAQHPTSNGTGRSAEPGRGILGMRERCQLLGGELTARSLPGGGFEVKARLPLAPTGTAHL